MAEAKESTQKHEGYASGSTVLDAATWTAAVEKLLAASSTVTEKDPQSRDGREITRVVHDTDPPENGRWTRKQPRPGPLPTLVLEDDIAKDAKTVEHEHSVLPGEENLDATCYHMAFMVVSEARRQRANGLALRDPVTDDNGMTVLGVVLVL